MRRFLLILLILLLPLRGWAVESMSVPSSAMPEDCPMMAPAADADDGQQGAHHAVQKSSCGCQSCHLCMPLAQAFAAWIDAVLEAPASVLSLRETIHVDADLALAIKPPIS